MRRFTLPFVLCLPVLLISAFFSGPVKPAGGLVEEDGPQDRLVVFEGFLRPSSPLSHAAAEAVNRLAAEYAAYPVIFLEYDVDNPESLRYIRYWHSRDSFGDTGLPNPPPPYTMVDSGHQLSGGPAEFYDTYKSMIETSLARPPKAIVEAYQERIGDSFHVVGRVTNLTPTTFSNEGQNRGYVTAISFEEGPFGLTGRVVRDVAEMEMSRLASGRSAPFALTVTPVGVVNWDRLRTLVVFDYCPRSCYWGPKSEWLPYDLLQATFADTPDFTLQPSSATFIVDPIDTTVPPLPLSFEGSGHDLITWTASTSELWLAVTPASGSLDVSPSVTIFPDYLEPGWQQGYISLIAGRRSNEPTTKNVFVQVYFGPLQRVYLPVLRR